MSKFVFVGILTETESVLQKQSENKQLTLDLHLQSFPLFQEEKRLGEGMPQKKSHCNDHLLHHFDCKLDQIYLNHQSQN